MPKMAKYSDPDRRTRANLRERQRVSEMNSMFKVLLDLLPPSQFRQRLSRAQILKEATNYIARLSAYLESSEASSDDDVIASTLQNLQNPNAFSVFPHIFNKDRKSNKDAYRRPLKMEEGGVAAFISRHELPQGITVPPVSTVIQAPPPLLPVPILKPTPVPFSQTNFYIAYLS